MDAQGCTNKDTYPHPRAAVLPGVSATRPCEVLRARVLRICKCDRKQQTSATTQREAQTNDSCCCYGRDARRGGFQAAPGQM